MSKLARKNPLGRSRTALLLGTSALVASTLIACSSTTTSEEDSSGGVSEVTSSDSQDGAQQPNIMMVLLDDMGYADLGAYGSEIDTPNIDALAAESTMFSNFHTYPLCAPTRAALLTGQDPHRVGLGSMEDLTPPGVPQTTPGYKGSLEGDFTGLAETMGSAGYDTYQVGKWHLGGGQGQTPTDLGFDHNFTLYDAGASYFSDALRLSQRTEDPEDTVIYERDGEIVDTLPEDFFATRSYTDEMIGMVDQSIENDQPFFGYLAYTAPHDPLHVEDRDLINHYFDKYKNASNYQELRDARIQRMVEIGLIESDVNTRWPEQVPEWDVLTNEQKEDLALRLAVYAAAIHEADLQVGRVIDHLKETGEYDNTLIVVASDNGPAGNTRQLYIRPGTESWHAEHYPLIGDAQSYGLEGSFPSLALPNAQISSGPFFHVKNTLFEGGTRVPAIIKQPASESNGEGRIVETFAHITDLYPTFADYAGADVGPQLNLMGSSARPLLTGSSQAIGDDEFGGEHFGHRVYRSGNWKLIFAPEAYGGTGDYALYDLATDPGETRDVIQENPEIARKLGEQWQKYAEDNGVVVVDFEAVNKVAPVAAERSFTVDWAESVE